MYVRTAVLTTLVAAAFCATPSASLASLIVTAGHADDPLESGASLDDVRLEVSLSVAGGRAAMTLGNASVSPEESCVFKTLVVDVLDDDTGEAVLWNPTVRDDLSDGVYTVGDYNVLPGFNPLIDDGASMIELNAANPAPHKGISPGESLVVEFDTSLPDGADIFDYLSFFDGGNDTQAYCLGFHGISTDTIVRQGSLSGAHVPEPASAALSLAGACSLLAHRRRRGERR